MLEAAQRKLASLNVETQFEIAVRADASNTVDQVATSITSVLEDSNTAALIQSNTNAALNSTDWSSDAFFSANPPTVTSAPTVSNVATAAVAGVVASGPVQIQVYDDNSCTTMSAAVAPNPVDGTLGSCSALTTPGAGWDFLTCDATKIYFKEASTCSGSTWVNRNMPLTSTCTAWDTKYVKTYCGTVPTAANASPAAPKASVLSPVVALTAAVFVATGLF
jgi:hypothetical protein